MMRFFKFLSSLIVLNCILLPIKGEILPGISTVAGNKQYYIDTTQKGNFYEGVLFCAQYDMTLASIENKNEDNALFTILKANGIIDQQYWLAGTSKGVTELPYYWLGTGKAATYKTLTYTADQCLLTTAGSTDYEAVDCIPANNGAFYYICEKPLEPNCGKYGQCRYTYSYSTN